MKSNIKKNKKGIWEIRATYTDESGRRRYIRLGGYATKHDADADYDRAIEEWKAKHSGRGSGVAFSQVLDSFFEFRKSIVRPLTLENERIICSKWFKSLSGKTTSGVYNADALRSFYSSLMSNVGLSSCRKNSIVKEFRSITEFAFNSLYINADQYRIALSTFIPARHATTLKSTMSERVAWTEEEISRFVSVLPEGTEDKAMFVTLLSLGCRIGELLGLQRSDVDFSKNVISITKQVNTHGEIAPTKTDVSVRHEAVSKSVCDMLGKYCDKMRIKEDGFLFPSPWCAWKPMSRTQFRRLLYFYEDKAGVRRNVPHGLRVTQSTLLFAQCKTYDDVKAVAQRMGHSVEMTLNTYQRMMKDNQRELYEKSPLNLKI